MDTTNEPSDDRQARRGFFNVAAAAQRAPRFSPIGAAIHLQLRFGPASTIIYPLLLKVRRVRSTQAIVKLPLATDPALTLRLAEP